MSRIGGVPQKAGDYRQCASVSHAQPVYLTANMVRTRRRGSNCPRFRLTATTGIEAFTTKRHRCFRRNASFVNLTSTSKISLLSISAQARVALFCWHRIFHFAKYWAWNSARSFMNALNATSASIAGNSKGRVRSICSDATAFELPATNLVCYFFNPFDSVVLKSVLSNMATSLSLAPRKAFIVYHYPQDKNLFGFAPRFHLLKEWRKYCIYRWE